MLIYVVAPSGRTTGVSLRPSDTVGDLKVRLEDEEWIPQDKQCLTYCNDKLEDGHTFESYGIGEGATIHLSRPDYAERDEVYCIYVQRTEEEVFRVRIKASDTIGSLKTRLWNGRLTPHNQQHLIFNQQQLKDGYKFSDYNIQESTTIRFPRQMDKVFPISVQPMTGGCMVRRLEVTGSETVGNLKVRLWDGGPRREQLLIFDGMSLMDRRTFSDYNIQEEAIIDLLGEIGATSIFPIHIRYPTGETTRILIEGINTIGDLKSRLQVEPWVPRDMQQLIFDGQKLEDKKQVFDYNIQRESTIDLDLPSHLFAPFCHWVSRPINIFIKGPGRVFPIRVIGTDTIDNVKLHIQDALGAPPDEQRLIFAGQRLENGRIISEYGIQNEVTIFLVLRFRGGGPVGDTRQSLGLVNTAQAISLWDWDGIMPGPGNKNAGLRLRKGDVVTVGRIVNDEWYQGYQIEESCGYFPRDFVSVRKIESSEFRDDIHVDDTPIEELQLDVTNAGSSVKAPSKLLPQRLLGITSKLFPSTDSTPPLPDSNRPDPPSPVPAPPAFDEIVDGNRVLVQFSLDPKDNQKHYTLRAKVSLNSAPGARFSGLTIDVSLVDGTILAISPENVDGPETEAEVTKDKNFQASSSTSFQVGSTPLSASIGASTGTSFQRAEHITFTRRTRGTVQGNGVGSSRAYWVMKEDSGPAAEQGLGPVFDLMVKLNVRPAVISFGVIASVLCERGKRKTINSRILGTSV